MPLNCQTNPDLAAIQGRLVRQGWAQICFEVLNVDHLKELHLSVLQLLMALTGAWPENPIRGTLLCTPC